MSEQVSGQGFSTTTSLDHRSWIWVASLLSLLYALLCLAARFVGKWDLLWYDDVVLCLGYLFSFVHWGLLFQAIRQGLGVSSLAISPETLVKASRLYFAARIPFFVAHCLAKLSVLVFTRRIFSGDIYEENALFCVSYGTVILYGILAVLLSSAGCRPTQILVANTDAVCDSNAVRWGAVTAVDALTEIVTLAMPIYFISKNELKASKKRIVVFVYMFRLIVIPLTICTTVSYFNFLRNGRDDIGIAPVVAWQEVLLCFSLISTSFPCLRSFLWAFMSRGLLSMYGNTTIASSSHHMSIQLRSLNNLSQVSRKASEAGESRVRLRPEQLLE